MYAKWCEQVLWRGTNTVLAQFDAAPFEKWHIRT